MSTTEERPPPADPAVTEIAGMVGYLYCQRPKFCAGVISVQGRDLKFSVKGWVKANEPVTLRGKWTVHKKYGKQFEATEAVYSLPANPDGLVQWLKWYGDGIGAVKAQQLVDEFDMTLMARVCDDPQQVAAAVRVPIECIKRLAERWTQHSGKVIAATQLAAWGCTRHEAEQLLAKFGEGVVLMLEDDPFSILGEVPGLGWEKIDGIAAGVGVVGTDPRRLRGAVTLAVRDRYHQGSTAVPTSVACALAADKVGGGLNVADAVARTVDEAVRQGRFVRLLDCESGSEWLATKWAHACEAGIWAKLETSRQPNPCGVMTQRGAGELVRQSYALVDGKTLDPGQQAAVAAALTHRIAVVTGGAGAGKTLVARAIHRAFDDADVPVMLCAPTGKAARRMEEVIGAKAQTIHRLLEYSGQTGTFKRDAGNPLDAGVVICDEASMVDAELGYYLLRALSEGTALVLIGDPNQLPPVGPGALLRDVLAHGLAPVARLEQCHRQAGTLKQNCHRILSGVVEPWASDEEPSPWVVSRKCDTPERVVKVIEDLHTTRLRAWGFDPVRDTQFMTAKHDGLLGTKRLNLILQRLHQASLGNALDAPGEDDHEKRPTFHAGDKVIHVKNNYDLDVMNGTVGAVVKTSPILEVEYEGRVVGYSKMNEDQLQLGYCLTPHKMQGSEVPCAVLVVPKAHHFMQHRHWTYTGVTRAKRTTVVIGDDDGIRRAAERIEADKRETLLQVFSQYEDVRP